MSLKMHNFRIVWNGNDYWDSTPDYDAVSRNSAWMVVNGSTMVNQDANDNGDLYFWRTLLDRIGIATTPTAGYNESAHGGSDKSFHGPFQRRMLLGTADQGANATETGRWVHLMRYSSIYWPKSSLPDDGTDDYTLTLSFPSPFQIGS